MSPSLLLRVRQLKAILDGSERPSPKSGKRKKPSTPCLCTHSGSRPWPLMIQQSLGTHEMGLKSEKTWLKALKAQCQAAARNPISAPLSQCIRFRTSACHAVGHERDTHRWLHSSDMICFHPYIAPAICPTMAPTSPRLRLVGSSEPRCPHLPRGSRLSAGPRRSCRYSKAPRAPWQGHPCLIQSRSQAPATEQ